MQISSRFASIRYIKRSQGGSSCATAAYNARTRIHCRYTQQTFDFSKKKGLYHHSILLPSWGEQTFLDPSYLWNQIELCEKRKDSQVAKEILLRLPNTLSSHNDRLRIVHSFVREYFCTKGIIAQADIHVPPYEKNSNWHAHILTPLRRLDSSGKTFLPYKASDLEPSVRGRTHHVIAGQNIVHVWCSHVDHFSHQHNLGIISAHKQLGALKNEGARYTSTPSFIMKHNAHIHHMRQTLFAHPPSALINLLHKKDIFSLHDLYHYLASCAPSTDHLAIVEDILNHPDVTHLGDKIAQRHYGLFTTKNIFNVLNTHVLPKTITLAHTTKHTPTPSCTWIQNQQQNNITIPNAQNLTTYFLLNHTQKHPYCTLEHGPQSGPSSYLWAKPKPFSIHIIPQDKHPLEETLLLWQKSPLHTKPLLVTHKTEHNISQAARSFLRTQGSIKTQDIYIGTPQGPLPITQNERVVWTKTIPHLPGIITHLSTESLSIQTEKGSFTRSTNTCLPIKHHYTHTNPHTTSFHLCLPPLTPSYYALHSHVLVSARHTPTHEKALAMLASTSQSAWHPALQDVDKHLLKEQLLSAQHTLTWRTFSLEEKLHQWMHRAHTHDIPYSFVHIVARSALFQHIFDKNTKFSLAWHCKNTPMLVAHWKTAPHPPTPTLTLCLEESFTQKPHHILPIVTQNPCPLSFITLLENRHHNVLSERAKYLAQQAHFAACNTTPPHEHSWHYYDFFKQRDWNFYHLLYSQSLPLHNPPLCSIYHHLKHKSPDIIFNINNHKEHTKSSLPQTTLCLH